MAAFADVLLRALGLTGQALVLGGVAFALVVLRPLVSSQPDPRPLLGRTLGLVALGALGMALAQSLAVLLQLASVADEAGWPVREALRAAFFRANLVRLLACVGVLVGCRVLRQRPAARGGWTVLVVCALVLGAGSAWLGHAAGRLERRAPLLALDALHQIGAGVWVGGLVHLMVFALRRPERSWPAAVLQRFSGLALAAVAILVAAGLGLSLSYVDGIRALVGTAYGVMVLTKAVVLAGLLFLGGMNFVAVRRLVRGGGASLLGLRRLVEVEVGLGMTAFFAAASLTSLPPAVDVVVDRATLAEVATRFAPRWPSLTTPTIDELLASAAPITDLRASRRPEEYAWSEYNHHVAGLFILAMGLLASLERAGWARWARHWPLLFLGLAAVLFVRNDPRAWPLGPAGFWESMALPDVLQHRIFVLVVVAFGLFEWMVRTRRLRSPGWALVFPLCAAAAGGLLITHSHAMFNLKAEFLVEVTHTPLGLLGLFVGWTRWLELRLPPPGNRVPARLWGPGLALVGILLLLYRER